jgi:hypothetical protein
MSDTEEIPTSTPVQHADAFFEKIKKHLFQYYTTCNKLDQCDFHYTTNEVFEQLQQLYPSAKYTPADVAVWLNEGGYHFFDFGKMNFEWLFKKL